VSPHIARAARWLLALLVVGLLVSFVDVGSIGTRLAGTDFRLAVPAVFGLVVVHVIAATAWRRLLRTFAGVALGWATTLRLYYAAQVLGTFTPGNLGADVYRVLAVETHATRSQLAQPVLVQRLTSVVAIVVLGGVGGLALPMPGREAFLLGAATIGIIVAVGSVAVVGVARGHGWRGGIAWRLGWNDGGTSGRERLWSAIRDGFVLGLLFHGASLLLGLSLVRAVDLDASANPSMVLGALAVARLSLAIPVSPNGIGIQEGLLAILFVQLGLPADAAVAAALLNRLGFLLTSAIGAVLLVSGSASRAPHHAPEPAAGRRVGRLGRLGRPSNADW
jgi:uncharacterized membrane protein YbhN (UPF0104 family)